MRVRTLRRRSEKLVDTLDIPTPFDVDELCSRVAARRGRVIELHPVAMPADGPCGVWVSAGGRDYILYERHTSPLHQEHIKLHEFGHLLSDHRHTDVLAPELSRLLLPSLDPAVVNRVLGRTQYTAEDEREAELIASLILERANRWRPTSDWPAPPDTADLRMRIGRSLEPPAGAS